MRRAQRAQFAQDAHCAHRPSLLRPLSYLSFSPGCQSYLLIVSFHSLSSLFTSTKRYLLRTAFYTTVVYLHSNSHHAVDD